MLDFIANEAPLGPERRDHALRGAWANHRECHVGGVFLLIYQVDDSPKPSGSINFVRAGTHIATAIPHGDQEAHHHPLQEGRQSLSKTLFSRWSSAGPVTCRAARSQGTDGSVTLDSETDVPMCVLVDPSTGEVRDILRGMPQADAAALALQAGSPDSLGVLSSRGSPDAAAWGR